MNSETDQEVEDNFQEFWKDIILNKDGTVNIEQVKKELFDYSFMLKEVPKVYCAITNNTLSKPNYHAHAVLSVHEECLQEAIKEAIQEYEEERAIDTESRKGSY